MMNHSLISHIHPPLIHGCRVIRFIFFQFCIYRPCSFLTLFTINAQVLTYRPGTLLYDPATLDSKLAALGNAGVPAGTLRSVVRDAPRCLSVGTNALVSRVSALTEAFPTVPLRRLLGDAPGLLVKKIDLVGQVCVYV